MRGMFFFIFCFLFCTGSLAQSESDSVSLELEELREKVIRLENEQLALADRLEEMDSVFSVELVEGGAERFSNAWPP